MQRKALVASAVLALLACVPACQREVREVEPPRVRVQVPDATLVAVSKVMHEGRQIGWLRTYRYEDRERQEVTWVQDDRRQTLGFVTEDGLAYRNTAHDGQDLVANNTDMRRNVAAVFGMPLADLRIEPVADAR